MEKLDDLKEQETNCQRNLVKLREAKKNNGIAKLEDTRASLGRLSSMGSIAYSRKSTINNPSPQSNRMSVGWDSGYGRRGTSRMSLGRASMRGRAFPKSDKFDINQFEDLQSTFTKEYQLKLFEDIQKTKNDMIDLIIERIDDLV